MASSTRYKSPNKRYIFSNEPICCEGLPSLLHYCNFLFYLLDLFCKSPKVKIHLTKSYLQNQSALRQCAVRCGSTPSPTQPTHQRASTQPHQPRSVCLSVCARLVLAPVVCLLCWIVTHFTGTVNVYFNSGVLRNLIFFLSK